MSSDRDKPPGGALPLDGQFDTVEYWAGRLQVDERTVRQMIERGELPALRAGRQWRIPRKLACEWLYKACVRTPAAAVVATLLGTIAS